MTPEAAAHALPERLPNDCHARSRQIGWRLSSSQRRFVLAAHIIISVGLFGAYAALLMLAVAGAMTTDPVTSSAAYGSMGILKGAVPPAAIGVVVTGVVLSLGASWGLFTHRWIVVKLVLTVAALPVSILLVFPSIQQAMAAPAPTPAPPMLVAASGLVVVMLGAATVIAVYKPWGLIARGRRVSTRPAA